MSEITNIMVAIDAEDILANVPPSLDPNRPAMVPNRYIYMVVKNQNALSGNGTATLDVKANVGDIIRFRETSLSGNFEESVVFYEFRVHSGGANISLPPGLIGGVPEGGPPAYTTKRALPKRGAPLNPATVDVPYHYWQTTAMSRGTVVYVWRFMILNDRDQVLGYYEWDPTITIQDP